MHHHCVWASTSSVPSPTLTNAALSASGSENAWAFSSCVPIGTAGAEAEAEAGALTALSLVVEVERAFVAAEVAKEEEELEEVAFSLAAAGAVARASVMLAAARLLVTDDVEAGGTSLSVSISTQLEAAVLRVSAREQAQQQALKEQQDGRIVAEHQGQVFEFAELENEIAHNEALIEEREQDINKIHQSVAQVNEIFRDLAAIVQDQQGAIDDIETHVHESMQQTQQGLDEVKKASDMQSYCAIQ
ncbi:hypothetical protein ON010_g10867 [Phytophthora cinnamomi]|nr:hypothetical protein ON010_g10867 [Phytophthora cinnamomi]